MKYVTVKKKCPHCEKGEMKADGFVYSSYPPSYRHKCIECGNLSSYRDMHPRSFTEYEPKEKEERWET